MLEEAIWAGVNSAEYFALAAGVSDGRYLELKFNQSVGAIDNHCVLVKITQAKEQLEREAREKAAAQAAATFQPVAATEGQGQPAQPGQSGASCVTETAAACHFGPDSTPPGTPEPPTNKRFFMSATLDTTRINRDVSRMVDEMISYLTTLDGSRVEITLEVSAKNKDGFPVPTVRTVSENCRTLKVVNFGFGE